MALLELDLGDNGGKHSLADVDSIKTWVTAEIESCGGWTTKISESAILHETAFNPRYSSTGGLPICSANQAYPRQLILNDRKLLRTKLNKHIDLGN